MLKVKTAIKAYIRYHEINSRPNSIRSFNFTLERFSAAFSERDVSSLEVDEVFEFLEEITTTAMKQSTKNSRSGHLSAFFNFTADTLDATVVNLCSKGIIKKLYKSPRKTQPVLVDKEKIDEIIYKADGRDRIILELMGRTAMRVGEVLSFKPRNLSMELNTISLETPKSGRAGEVVYLSQKIMSKVNAYIRKHDIKEGCRVFSISYTTVYRMVRRLGKASGVQVAPHDFRRHAATQASRSNVPLEIISKIILRHSNISTTERYLGTVSPIEASRTIETFLS